MASDAAPRIQQPGVGATWIAFLVMAFAIVGLMGIFATFAGPIPLERALARETALSEARALAQRPDAATALEALRPALGDSAAAILPWSPDIDRRIAAEQRAVRHRFQAEAGDLAVRLRWLVALVTVMAAAFGIAVLHASRRAPG